MVKMGPEIDKPQEQNSSQINYLQKFILVIIWKGPNVCILIVIYQTYISSQGSHWIQEDSCPDFIG